MSKDIRRDSNISDESSNNNSHNSSKDNDHNNNNYKIENSKEERKDIEAEKKRRRNLYGKINIFDAISFYFMKLEVFEYFSMISLQLK
jgi:hypothetical protein